MKGHSWEGSIWQVWTHLLRHCAEAFLRMSHPDYNGLGFSSKYAYGMLKIMHRHALSFIIAARFEHLTRLGCLHKPVHQLAPPHPSSSPKPWAGHFPSCRAVSLEIYTKLDVKASHAWGHPAEAPPGSQCGYATPFGGACESGFPRSQRRLAPLSSFRVSPQCMLNPPHCFGEPCLPPSQSREGLTL